MRTLETPLVRLLDLIIPFSIAEGNLGGIFSLSSLTHAVLEAKAH